MINVNRIKIKKYIIKFEKGNIMENKILYTIDLIKKEMINLSEEIFKNPELGFKEFETNKLI